MRIIHRLNRQIEKLPLDPSLDDSVSMALMNRLKARIARRESRFKTRVVEACAESQNDPPVMPAA
jgi:hypothetical protein